MSDIINRPSHYTDGNIEVIDYIEDKKFGYHLGNAIKYISRAGKKDNEIQDLKKAIWYIERHIKNIKIGTNDTDNAYTPLSNIVYTNNTISAEECPLCGKEMIGVCCQDTKQIEYACYNCDFKASHLKEKK